MSDLLDEIAAFENMKDLLETKVIIWRTIFSRLFDILVIRATSTGILYCKTRENLMTSRTLEHTRCSVLT